MLDRTKIGFEGVVSELKKKIKKKGAWKDIEEFGSTGSMLVDLYAYMSELMLYYLKRTAEEQFPRTAQLWSSLVRIANALGMYVKRPVGSEGKVKLKLRDSVAVEYKTIPKGTLVIDEDGVSFFTVEDVLVNKTDWVEVGVRQGVKKVVILPASGVGKIKSVILDDTTASDIDLKVIVNGVEWNVVTDFFELEGDKNVRVITRPDKKLELLFYDAFGGVEAGTQVTVEYMSAIKGYAPRIGGTWVVDDIDVEIQAVDGSFSEGSDWESVEELRSRFINYFGSGKRVVTKKDLELILKSVEGVEKVKVLDVKDEFKAPFRGAIAYVKETGVWSIGDSLRSRIEGVVDRLRVLGLKVDVYDVLPVDVNVYVIVKNTSGTMNSVQLKSYVVGLIEELYNNAEIGVWISRMKIVEKLMGNGVDVVSVVEPAQDKVLSDNMLCRLRFIRVDVV